MTINSGKPIVGALYELSASIGQNYVHGTTNYARVSEVTDADEVVFKPVGPGGKEGEIERLLCSDFFNKYRKVLPNKPK